MSGMEDRRLELEAMKFEDKTKAAVASIEQQNLAKEAQGYAVMAAVMGYGDGAMSDGLFGKVSRGAMWFCVWFAMIAPVYLFWRVVL